MEDINPLGWAVQQGLEGFVYRIGDMIYGVGGVDATNRSITDSMFITMMTQNIDPYSLQPVRDWQNYSAAAFLVIGMLALFIAFISSRVNIKSLDDLIGEGYTQNRIVDTLLCLLVIPIIAIFGVWVVLQLNYIISVFIADYMIMTIPQSSDNFIIYVCMAIAYILLSFVMIIRTILIVIFASVSLIVGVAYSIIELRPKAIEYTKSFISIVFLQSKLLFIMLIGIIVIGYSAFILDPNIRATAYLGLSLYVTWVGYKAIAGDTMTTIVKVAIFRRLR